MSFRSLLVLVPAALLIGVSDPSPAGARSAVKAPPEGIRVTINCRNEPSAAATYSLLKEGLYTQQYETFTIGCGETAEHVSTDPNYTIIGARVGVVAGTVHCAAFDLYRHDRYTCDKVTVQVK